MKMKKKIKLSTVLFLIVACFFVWFGHSFIGIDKETQVPKALLMRIRPLPWKEIYWDGENQLLKTAIPEKLASGDESRCLRIYCLTPSGLLVGGYQFLTRDSIGITNTFVDFEIKNDEISMFDERSQNTLFTLNISDICDAGEKIIGIYPGKVYYELGDEVILHVVLGYKTEVNQQLIYHEDIPEIMAVVKYTYEDFGSEEYELGEFYKDNDNK